MSNPLPAKPRAENDRATNQPDFKPLESGGEVQGDPQDFPPIARVAPAPVPTLKPAGTSGQPYLKPGLPAPNQGGEAWVPGQFPEAPDPRIV
jgi:hypothetical protein